MSTDGWQIEQGALFGDADLAALRTLAGQWPSLTPAQQAQQLAELQTRYPDLELTASDVAMILGKIQEMSEASGGGA